MKKPTIIFLSICFLFTLTSCAGQENTVQQSESESFISAENEAEEPSSDNNIDSIAIDATVDTEEDSSSHILIAYFTWADNTVVDDPESVDTDATTSASVLVPGNAAKLACWIQERTGGELFSIVVTEPYSSDYDECLERAAEEKAENARPELATHIENMEDYDIVFLGFPNWWYTVPMAIHSFIEEYDFSGKTVIPFVTHGTGGLAATIQDITAALPDSTEILEPIGIYRPEVDEAQSAVNAWLDELGFSDKTAETANTEEASENTDKSILLIVDGQEIAITLYDTPAANALYDMLPLELTFEDFNHIENIIYLPEELPTEGEPDGCDPDIGDFCLYEPWGNLSIFYQDFRESNGLIPLGHIESGIEILSGMTDDFTAILEKQTE